MTPAGAGWAQPGPGGAHKSPAVGSAERAHCCKWLVWLAATLQAQMPIHCYAGRCVAPGNAAGAAEVKAQAEALPPPFV